MDTIISSSELKLLCLFDDDDTRTITLENPRGGISATDIHDIETDMITTQPIIGDKTGASFTKFKRAYTVDKTRIILNI